MAASFPRVTANINSADLAAVPGARKILVVGQLLAAGSSADGALQTDIKSELEFNTLFGPKSHIAKMGRGLIKNLSISSDRPQVDAIGLADASGGTDATGSFAFSGTSTAIGTLKIYVDSKKNNIYSIDIAVGDTAAEVGDALAAAITADVDANFTAANSTSTVTITAANAGVNGNDIGLELSGSVAGIGVTITAMASGATNPTLTTLFDPIDGIRYTTIVYPYSWGTSTLTALTEARFNVDNKIIDGLGISCIQDTYANINSAADALNLKTFSLLGNKEVSLTTKTGGAILENPDVIACQVAAYRELRLTVGANTSSIVTNGQNQGGSFFGGIPYHNTPFINLPVIPVGQDFTDIEALELKNSGVWLLRNNPNNLVVLSNEAVTTYKTNTLGNADITFKYVNYVDTLTLVREYIFNNVKADFSQHILTTGDLISGRPMVNADSFIAAMVGYYVTLAEDSAYVLLRAGAAEKTAFRDAITKQLRIVLSTGTITADSIANIVVQVRNVFLNFTPTFET